MAKESPNIYWIQVEIPLARMKLIDEFKVKHGIRTNKDLVNRALDFYVKIMDELEKGKRLYSRDSDGLETEYIFL